MTITTYDTGPCALKKNPSKGLGGAAPSGFGFRDPARRPGPGPARITRTYPEEIQEGVWVGFGITFAV